MSERVQAYFTVLERLSSEELDRSACDIAAREKHDIARFVAHIAEIAARGYHLTRGYKNLFEYCTLRFNLSEGSVYRRTQVAGVCRRFPQILEAISRGHLHLTGASLIAPHLTEDNVEHLIAAARGKTKRELETLLVTLAPKKPFVPSLRKHAACVPEGSAPAVPVLQSGASECGAQTTGNAHAEAGSREPAVPEVTTPPTPARQHTPDLVQPATEERYNVRFSAGSEFVARLRRLAEVLGIECPRNHMEEVLSRALEIALDRKDPQRALERRRQRQARKEEARPGEGVRTEGPCRSDDAPHTGERTAPRRSAPSTPSRHVPVDVRERVLERAEHQCEYCGPDGTRCRSRTGLQVEHTLPFAVYGTHDEESLRAFCPAHNLHAARDFYGPGFIQRKIDAARGAQARAARCVAV